VEYTNQILIAGGKPLRGNVTISGAKNAAVAIIPAALCSEGVSVIENLPDIEDVRNYISALEKIGAVCEYIDRSTIKIDARSINTCSISFEALRDMRASYYLMGALLGRFGEAEIPQPGGCDFGIRPMDQHFKGFEALGATITQEHGMIKHPPKSSWARRFSSIWQAWERRLTSCSPPSMPKARRQLKTPQKSLTWWTAPIF